MTDGPGDHVTVNDWNDIDAAPDQVCGQDKDRIAALFRDGLADGADAIGWFPDFVLDDDDRDVDLVENSDHLAMGSVEDYSDDAWRFTQPHLSGKRDALFAPKSWTVMFERGSRMEDLETPQSGLGDFDV